MKKNCCIILLIIFSVTISACQNNHKTSEATKASTAEIVEEDSIKQVIEADANKDEFIEGVWIKNYPGNSACFELANKDGYQIVCDPYLINDDIQPDLVTESHQHGDHNDTSTFKEPYELITEPGDYVYNGITIRGFSGKHNIGDKEVTNIIYVFDIDGIKIAHFASQGEVPTTETLKQIGPVDVLLVQIFSGPGYGKLEVKDIDSIVSTLKPKIIIPEHGGYAIEKKLAVHMKLDEVYKTSGTLIVTRKMLDEIKEVKLISLDSN